MLRISHKQYILLLAVIAIVIASAHGYSDTNSARESDGRTGILVIDGDTIHEYKNGDVTEKVRLLGIDTPETTQSPSPEEWEGVSSAKCLRKYGIKAKEHLLKRMKGNSHVKIKTDPESDKRGYYDRLLAYVMANSSNVNYELVRNGLARYYESNFSQSQRFAEAERAARQNQTGAWGCQ